MQSRILSPFAGRFKPLSVVLLCTALGGAWAAGGGPRHHAEGAYAPSTSTYQVVEGDDLEAIAARFSLTLGELKAQIQPSSGLIEVGQTLDVTGAVAPEAIATAAAADSYWGRAHYRPYDAGYGCCAATSANVYRHWGDSVASGTRTWYRGDGVAGTTARGGHVNARTGTTGAYAAGRSYDARTGTAQRAYGRTVDTARGTSGAVEGASATTRRPAPVPTVRAPPPPGRVAAASLATPRPPRVADAETVVGGFWKQRYH